MKDNIKSLSMSMFDSLEGGSEGNHMRFYKDFEQLDFKEFLIYNFSMYSPSYLDRLMFSTKKYWENLSINDWKEVINKTANSELAIRYCLSFLYKYIGIDSLKLFASLSDINDVIKLETLKYFENNQGILAVFDRVYLSELEWFNLEPSDFFSARDKLLKEGAKSARKIYPDKIDFLAGNSLL